MEKEFINGLMEVYIKENILTELEKEKVNINGLMGEYIKECLKMVNLMEKEKFLQRRKDGKYRSLSEMLALIQSGV